jgi:hypothetical protein
MLQFDVKGIESLKDDNRVWRRVMVSSNYIFPPQIADIKEKVSQNRLLTLGVNLGDKSQHGLFFSFLLN